MTTSIRPRLPRLLTMCFLIAGTSAASPRAEAAGFGLEAGHGAFFRPPVNVSHSLGQSRLARVGPHSLVLDSQGPIFVIWVEVLPHSEGIAHELASCRYLMGAGWDTTYTPVWLWEGNPSTEPVAALDRERVLHLIWIEQQAEMRQVVGLRFGVTTGGVSTADPISEPARTVTDPDIAIDREGRVHVVWAEVAGPQSSLRHRRWIPGAGWDSVRTLDTGAGALSPALAAGRDGSLHVAWQRARSQTGEIMLAELHLDGRFGPPVSVSGEQVGLFAGPPAVAAAASGVWVAWNETDGSVNVVKARMVTASDLEPIVTLSTPGRVAEYPSLAVDPWETVHAVWIERGADDHAATAVVYTSLAPGREAAAPRPLSVGGTGPFESPAITADASGRVAVAWADQGVGNGDIFVRQGIAGFSPLKASDHASEP